MSKVIAMTDHLGNKFESQSAMLRHYNVTHSLYYKRLKLGWSLERILTTPSNSKVVFDHLGNEFKSVTSMCKYYNISNVVFYCRRKYGWGIEEILTTPIKESKRAKSVKDHLGNSFDSLASMCRFYSIEPRVFRLRQNEGWSLERILTTASSDKIFQDHLGNSFHSKADMCRFYGIGDVVFQSRIDHGWDLKDALTKPIHRYDEVGDYETV